MKKEEKKTNDNCTNNNFEKKRALTVEEAAKYACVSRAMVENWIAKRLIPYELLPGRGDGKYRFKRIRRTDLDAFLDSCYQPPEQIKPREKLKRMELLPRGYVNYKRSS